MSNLSTISVDSDWGKEASKINQNFANINTEVTTLKNQYTKFKGYFTSLENLQEVIPSAGIGAYAWVGEPYPGIVYFYSNGWKTSGEAADTSQTVELGDYYKKNEVDSLIANINTDQLGIKVGIVGYQGKPAEVSIIKGEVNLLSVYIPYFVITDNESFNVDNTLTAEFTQGGGVTYRIFINKDSKTLVLLGFNEVINSDSLRFLGIINVTAQYTITFLTMFGNWKVDGKTYSTVSPITDIEDLKSKISGIGDNSDKKTAYVGLHGTPADISITGEGSERTVSVNLPNYIVTDSDTIYVNKQFSFTITKGGLYRLFWDKKTSELALLFYNEKPESLDVLYLGLLNIHNTAALISFLQMFGSWTYNGITYSTVGGISSGGGSSAVYHNIAYVGMNTDPMSITSTNKGSNTIGLSINIPNYVFTDTTMFFVNKTFDFEVNNTTYTLYKFFIKKNEAELVLLKYNEAVPEDSNYLFAGFATIHAGYNTIRNVQFFGRWTVNGEAFSTVGSGGSSSGGGSSVPSTPKNILTYLHDKVYLVENEEYNIYKDSFYLNADGGMYANDDTELAIVTDTDIKIGSRMVAFNTATISGYEADNGVKNILGIYIDGPANRDDIAFYGVRCEANIAHNISGRSIKHTGIGDSHSDNRLFVAVASYLKQKGVNYTGVGLMTEKLPEAKNEGRSGWRYANLIGLSNAIGWAGQPKKDVVPQGDTKHNPTTLYINPFLKTATDEDKRLHPDRCYTYTAPLYDTSNYQEKSYQQVVEEGGDTSQLFYIFDIANYYRVQHDWDGSGNPVDCITIGLGGNDFFAKGFTQDTITEVLDSMTWVIDRIHEQLPNVMVGIIASPRWSYARAEIYKTCILPYIQQTSQLINQKVEAGDDKLYMIQPHIFMNGCYSYNRECTIKKIEGNDSCTTEVKGQDTVHYDSIGNWQYGKVLGSFLAYIASVIVNFTIFTNK